MNERFVEGDEILVDDIDRKKDREAEFQRVLYQRKGQGARFEYFKVEFGQLVGQRMRQQAVTLPSEIETIVNQVAALAKGETLPE